MWFDIVNTVEVQPNPDDMHKQGSKTISLKYLYLNIIKET